VRKALCRVAYSTPTGAVRPASTHRYSYVNSKGERDHKEMPSLCQRKQQGTSDAARDSSAENGLIQPQAEKATGPWK